MHLWAYTVLNRWRWKWLKRGQSYIQALDRRHGLEGVVVAEHLAVCMIIGLRCILWPISFGILVSFSERDFILTICKTVASCGAAGEQKATREDFDLRKRLRGRTRPGCLVRVFRIAHNTFPQKNFRISP